MATKKKLLQAAAGNAGGAGLDVDDVFSTYLYSGNSTARNISNGIDLSGEGGLVWTKLRGPNTSTRHVLIDTERGVEKYLESNTGDAEDTQSGNSLTAFNNNGYTIGNWGSMNASSQDYASWTFRKAPKFFDVVTWSGNSVSGREIPHNLGCAVGAMIIKRTNDSKYWFVYHRSTQATHFLRLNENFAAQDSPVGLGDVEPTSTVFTVSGDELVNQTGGTYVAYLFAHNDGDGDFGPDGDADIIKCGSFTTDGSGFGQDVNLGWEPQWLLVKRTDSASGGDWKLIDTMRGYPAYQANNSATQRLEAEDTAAEATQIYGGILSGTGFKIQDNASATYIYIAIRRGPLAPPESATDVFDVSVTDYSANQTIAANIDVTDTFMVGRQPTSNNSNGLYLFSRLTGNKRLRTDQTFSENAELGLSGFDTQNGVVAGSSDSNQSVWNASFPFIKYFMKRAPNFFDVVAYTGTGSARTVPHNLGVAPELIIFKARNTASDNWFVYAAPLGPTKGLYLNATNAAITSPGVVNDTAPTESVFSTSAAAFTNINTTNYIAYLFASLDGISKVGLVTHSGSSTDVDCGFASGARFVLLKRTDATGDWYFWDTTRGIVSGNDPYLTLNGTNQPEVTNTDYIDPLSSGFQISGDFTDGTYIFYAIA